MSMPPRTTVVGWMSSINNDIVQVKQGFLDAQLATGNQQIAAAPAAGLQVVVLAMALVNGGSAAAANTFQLRSASTPISPAWSLAASGQLVLPFNLGGWFVCTAAQALNLNVGASQGANQITQILVDYAVVPTYA